MKEDGVSDEGKKKRQWTQLEVQHHWNTGGGEQQQKENVQATVSKQYSAFGDDHAEELCSKMKYPHGGRNNVLPAGSQQASPHLYDQNGDPFLTMKMDIL